MKRYLFCIAIITLMFGCNREKSMESDDKAITSLSNDEGSDTTATPKIIKTADMNLRVKDVQDSKQKISEILKSQGGSVTEFSIQSTIQETQKVKYSLDSLKEITSYRTTGFLIAKVPSEKLDEFTNDVAKMAVFIDQQSLKMDDQSINYLANRLKAQNRAEALKSINKTAKRKNTNIETSLYIKDAYVDKQIENMNIDDRVKFSTITLNFYQDPTVKTSIVGNDHLYDYRPAFFQRLGLNLVDGWTYFKEFILLLANLWMPIVFGVVIYFGTKSYMKVKSSTK